MGQLKPFTVAVDFFKPESGKWYTSGKAEVSHHLFEDEFLQDIVDTQDAMQDGWQGRYTVVVRNMDDDDPFSCKLFLPSRFANVQKTEKESMESRLRSNCWTSHQTGGHRVKVGDVLLAEDTVFGLTESKEYLVLHAMFNEVMVENDHGQEETYSIEYFYFKPEE